MEEKIITLETAKLAKEKGFDWKCLNYWGINYATGEIPQINSSFNRHPQNYNGDKFVDQSYSAPTQSLVQKWLREEHNINVIAYPVIMQHNEEDREQTEEEMEYFYIIYNKGLEMFKSIKDPMFDTYEEALEDGLKSGLNLIGYEK